MADCVELYLPMVNKHTVSVRNTTWLKGFIFSHIMCEYAATYTINTLLINPDTLDHWSSEIK